MTVTIPADILVGLIVAMVTSGLSLTIIVLSHVKECKTYRKLVEQKSEERHEENKENYKKLEEKIDRLISRRRWFR